MWFATILLVNSSYIKILTTKSLSIDTYSQYFRTPMTGQIDVSLLQYIPKITWQNANLLGQLLGRVLQQALLVVPLYLQRGGYCRLPYFPIDNKDAVVDTVDYRTTSVNQYHKRYCRLSYARLFIKRSTRGTICFIRQSIIPTLILITPAASALLFYTKAWKIVLTPISSLPGRYRRLNRQLPYPSQSILSKLPYPLQRDTVDVAVAVDREHGEAVEPGELSIDQ